MAQALQNGTTLQNGKYKIVRFLGQGGFGITYLAENTMLEKKVAIKEFFPKDFCDREDTSYLRVGTESNRETVEKLKDRFLKEARNIARIDFPGIVKIYDIFKENNTSYFVMEYIEGENLNEIVKKNGPLSEEKAIEYIKDVGEALEHIHSKNMTHFDVKPSNIVIRKRDDKPILIDFGLSKQYNREGDATSTLLQGVSNGYSPIELYNTAENLTFSPQTDIYSLGGLLYFLMIGTVPLSASSRLNKTLTLPKTFPDYLSPVIQKAMAFSKGDRYLTVHDFIRALDNSSKSKNSFLENERTKLDGKIKKNHDNKLKILGPKFWLSSIFIFILTIILLSIIFFRKNKLEDLNIIYPKMNYQDSLSNIVETVTIEPDQELIPAQSSIATNAKRSFILSGYNYKEKFDIEADNGILYVKSKRNGEKISDQFQYNRRVDAEKILDQFEGLANFWAAENVGEYIIDSNGFFSEEIMYSTLGFLNSCMNLMSKNKGDCPLAYEGAKSIYEMLSNILKDYENSSSFKEEWRGHIEAIIWGMGENPIQAKDIRYSF